MVLSVDVAVVVPVKRSVEVNRSVDVAVVFSVDVAVVRWVVVKVFVEAGSVDVTVLPGAVVTYVLTAYRTALALR